MERDIVKTPTVGAQGGTIGRPRKDAPPYLPREVRETPPVDLHRQLETLASNHMGLKRIAVELGTTDKTLSRWMTQDPMLRWSYEAGKAKAEHELYMTIVEGAREGDKLNMPAVYGLNNRHGWRQDQIEDKGRVNIVFNIPAAQSPEDYMKKVLPSG